MSEASVSYWEEMYRQPLEALPWEIKEPPRELQDYFTENPVNGGAALDVGCGTGNFSFYLARLGFDVTAVDFSKHALAIGRETNQELRLPVYFKRADVTRLLPAIQGRQFDFVLDYKLLHHLPDEQAADYATQFPKLLASAGRLLLVCYADKDKPDQPFRAGKFGNVMYYRSAEQIREFYSGLREVSYREVTVGKRLNHVAHCFVFENTKPNN